MSIVRVSPAPLTSYSTTFPATENPISESSQWLNGLADGLDWTNVQTGSGNAYGTQSPINPPPYDDSVAILRNWSTANQYCQATVFNSSATGQIEVELWLRGSVSAHSITGYEVDITPGLVALARWNGALNNFTILVADGSAAGFSIANGTVWYAQMVGTVITVKCNGNLQFTYDTASDTPKYATGAPGIGFYRSTQAGAPSAANTLGFSDWAAGSL